MKATVICTYPLYTGIFLNKKSKKMLMDRNPDNVLRPKYNHICGHHVTLRFNPGGNFGDIKWGALVEMNVVRHIWNEKSQAIEVVPTKLTYKNNDKITEVLEVDEIKKILNGNNNRYNITLSLLKSQDINKELIPSDLDKIILLDDDELINMGYIVENFNDLNIKLTGFIAQQCNARIEDKSVKELEKYIGFKNKMRKGRQYQVDQNGFRMQKYRSRQNQ